MYNVICIYIIYLLIIYLYLYLYLYLSSIYPSICLSCIYLCQPICLCLLSVSISINHLSIYINTSICLPICIYYLPTITHLSISLPIVVQFLSHMQLFVTPWTAAHQASLSITNSQSLLKPMSIELVMPSNHLILCRPLLLLPSIFPSVRVFSNESALCITWLKYWSFRFIISPSTEYSGLISKESFIFKELAHAVVEADKSNTFQVDQQAEDLKKELMFQLKRPREHLLAGFLFFFFVQGRSTLRLLPPSTD